MKKTLSTLFTTSLLIAVGFMVLTATGCGTPLQSTNDSDRPWNETRGFQHQGASRLDR
ncbi:MAG: hypothetical protein ACKJR1_13625 [Limisphaerales bacterium]|jgi:hypothetical protein|nr:hypothetical protein [Verrucomicrobiota bacterium]|tara:strand:+ start:526 stop:699 length:174 start_codon:yes stop_codon:yes gene_type:complete